MKWNYCLRYTFDLNLQVYDLLVNQDQSVYRYASSAFRVLMAAKNRITITGLNNRLSLSHHYYLGKSNYSAVFTDSLATSVSLLRTKMSQYVVYQTSLLLVTCHEQIGKKISATSSTKMGPFCYGLQITDTLLQIIIPRCLKDRFLHRLHFHAQLFPAVQFFGFSRNTLNLAV